jgi:hypothetical protein
MVRVGILPSHLTWSSMAPLHLCCPLRAAAVIACIHDSVAGGTRCSQCCLFPTETACAAVGYPFKARETDQFIPARCAFGAGELSITLISTLNDSTAIRFGSYLFAFPSSIRFGSYAFTPLLFGGSSGLFLCDKSAGRT